MKALLGTGFIGTCLAVLMLAAPAHATFSGQDGKIAYQGSINGGVEIFSINADGTGKTQLTNNPASDLTPAWSPDGTKIAFASNRDGNYEIYKMNADGSAQTRITNNPADDLQPDWSPDGTKLAFTSNRDGNQESYTVNIDGANIVRLTNNSGVDSFPAWSPDGTKIAFQSKPISAASFNVYKMNADGTGQTELNNGISTDNERPNWSDDGAIYFDGLFSGDGGQRTILAMDADGTGVGPRFRNTSTSNSAYAPSPSPSHKKLAFVYDAFGPGIFVCDGSGPCGTDTCSVSAPHPGCRFISFGEYPDWQPIPYPGYARPKGATPFRASLVPAYAACSSPNSSHRGSIGSASCVPPTPESHYLTVGSPDFNGVGANSIGSVLFKLRATTPEDISIAVNDSDVRCAGTSGGCPGGALSDYGGDLRFDTTFRITDKGNGGGLTGNPGTVADLPVRFSVPCATTVSTTVGSSCSINTTIDTLLGASAIVASQRAIWQLNDNVKLYDGGADGVASTSADNTLFAVGGLFAP